MIDRRMVTDVGLALLIALPAALPAAPSPWNTAGEVARAETSAEAPANVELAQSVAAADKMEPDGYGRS